MSKNKEDQLCWDCKRAIGLCPWSQRGEAIKGWTAEKTLIPNGCESEETTMTMDNESNIIELIDDETGATVPFEHLATIEHEGEYYIALMLIEEEDANDDEGEVVIMKIEADEEGNECYVCVEDEDLQETVFEKFLQLMEEAEDEE